MILLLLVFITCNGMQEDEIRVACPSNMPISMDLYATMQEQPLSVRILHDYNISYETAFCVLPFLSQRLRKEKINNRAQLQHLLNHLDTQTPLTDPALKCYSHSLVVDAMRDLIIDQRTALEKIDARMQDRWTRKKVGYCAAISAFISTCITASVSLLIHYSS